MTNYKAGFHKKISSIFDGVPVQKESGGAVSQKPSLPDFITEQSDVPPAQKFPSVQMPHKESAPPPPKPVQKLYKDTAEKTQKAVSKTSLKIDLGLSKIYEAVKAKLFKSKPQTDKKRQMVSVALVPVLGIVLIVVIYQFYFPKQPTTPTPPPVVPVSGQTQNIKPVKINWQIPKLVSATMRDPMKPLYGTAVTVAPGTKGDGSPKIQTGAEIVLKAIVYSPDDPLVVIDTKYYRVGDKIGDVSIVKITEDFVTFQYKGQTKDLTVGQNWLPVDQFQ